MDLNHRPPGPEPGALARLRYAPTGPLRAKDSFRVELSEYHSSPADGSGAASHQCLWSIIARANKLKVGLSRDSCLERLPRAELHHTRLALNLSEVGPIPRRIQVA